SRATQRPTLFGLITLFLTAVMTACVSPAPSATSSASTPATASTSSKDVFTMGQSTPIPNLNPNPWNAANQIWRRAIFDTLVTVDPQPRPSLATSWNATPDGKVFTFTIQSGVKFHNGKSFDAQS